MELLELAPCARDYDVQLYIPNMAIWACIDPQTRLETYMEIVGKTAEILSTIVDIHDCAVTAGHPVDYYPIDTFCETQRFTELLAYGPTADLLPFAIQAVQQIINFAGLSDTDYFTLCDLVNYLYEIEARLHETFNG